MSPNGDVPSPRSVHHHSRMTVQPYTSPYDQNPFNPNASGGSSGGTTIPGSSPVPDLAMYWTAPPDLTPSSSGGSSGSSSSGSSGPAMDSLYVDLGGVRDREQTMLTAASTIVDAYESLKSLFLSGEDTVFGQQAGTTTYTQTYSEQPSQPSTQADPIQQTAQQFADGTNGQPGMNAVQEYALEQVADCMAVIGEFIALLNSAAQQYAQADASSALPPAS